MRWAQCCAFWFSEDVDIISAGGHLLMKVLIRRTLYCPRFSSTSGDTGPMVLVHQATVTEGDTGPMVLVHQATVTEVDTQCTVVAV